MFDQKTVVLSCRLLRVRLRVGRLWGVAVSIHWSWFVCLAVWVALGRGWYSSWPWMLGQLLILFAVILMHELGHAMAARRLGQKVCELILWPLGGVVFLDFSQRWSTELLIAAAGPAVNLLLVPLTFSAWYWFGYYRGGDVSNLLWRASWDNVGILVFNLLPIWPLDGGRIAQAAMKARVGLIRSRIGSSMLSLFCAAGATPWLVRQHAFVGLALLTILILVNAESFQSSLRVLAAERRRGVRASERCPHCGSRALDGPNWICRNCGERCNLFITEGHCWKCNAVGGPVPCASCGNASEISAWRAAI